MTPSARLSAAIEILDQVLVGEPVEKCLTRWSRSSRFAGSKDRAAVRDIVFDAIRCRNSYAFAGGAMTGRGLVLGGVLASGDDPEMLFSGTGYGPVALSDAELSKLTRAASPDPSVRLDFAQELDEELKSSLGDDFEAVLDAMRSRAPVDLRINLKKLSRSEAQQALRLENIETDTLANCQTALRVTDGARKIKSSQAYLTGMVELQDVSSQRVAEFAAPRAGEVVLDYCAGGGGKSLALGGICDGEIKLHAFDVNPKRMFNLPERARRADLDLEICDRDALAKLIGRCDLVMVDAPCSGSGSWRRLPQQKWLLDETKLRDYNAMQDDALESAAKFVSDQGRLIYATCSIFRSENQDRLDAFLARNPGWQAEGETQLTPLTGGDGFFFARVVRI